MYVAPNITGYVGWPDGWSDLSLCWTCLSLSVILETRKTVVVIFSHVCDCCRNLWLFDALTCQHCGQATLQFAFISEMNEQHWQHQAFLLEVDFLMCVFMKNKSLYEPYYCILSPKQTNTKNQSAATKTIAGSVRKSLFTWTYSNDTLKLPINT